MLYWLHVSEGSTQPSLSNASMMNSPLSLRKWALIALLPSPTTLPARPQGYRLALYRPFCYRNILAVVIFFLFYIFIYLFYLYFLRAGTGSQTYGQTSMTGASLSDSLLQAADRCFQYKHKHAVWWVLRSKRAPRKQARNVITSHGKPRPKIQWLFPPHLFD